MKITALSEGSQLRRLIRELRRLSRSPSVNHATVPYSQTSLFIENQGGDVRTL